MTAAPKTVGFALALCLLTAVLSGCWDYRDLERRSSIMGMGVDLISEDGKSVYRVTVEIPHPTGGGMSGGLAGGGGDNGNGESPTPKVIVVGEGSSFGAALIALDARVERLPLWEHLLAVVIAESVARDGLAPVIDGLIRSTVLNSRARLFVTDGKAEDFIRFLPQLHPLTSRFLRGLEEQFAEYPRFHRSQDVHSLDRRLEEAGAALIPRVQMHETSIVAEGAAIIHAGYFAGWLDPEMTEGSNWWLGQINSAILEFPCPAAGGAEPVTVRARLSRSSVKARVKDGKPEFHGEIDALGRLIDLAHCPLNPGNPGARKRLEASASEALEQVIRGAIDRAQGMNVDFLQLGLYLRRREPDIWKQIDWREVFPEVPVHISVKFTIDDTGERHQAPRYR